MTDKIMYDAMRRQTIAIDRNKTQMVILQFPSHARLAVEAGLITPYAPETPRCLSWYNLTRKGLERTQQLYKQLESNGRQCTVATFWQFS